MKTANTTLFLLLVIALITPVLGSEIPYAREFTVMNLSGTPVQGTIDMPSTLASFTVQSSLAAGLRISVDAHGTGPELPDPLGTSLGSFFLRIYRDGVQVRDLALGDFGQLDANLQPTIPHVDLTSANFPEGFQTGSVYTLVGGYAVTDGIAPIYNYATLHWPVDHVTGTLMKTYQCDYVFDNTPNLPENLEEFSFFHGNPNDISLAWIDNGVGYQPYPDANSQSIATNYGIPLHFDLTQSASAADLNYLTATLFQDDGDQVFNDDDTPVESVTYDLSGEESFTLPMFDRSGSNFSGWHFLKIQVTNLFGISQDTVVSIASLRALEIPPKARWALHFPDTIVHQIPNGNEFDVVTYQPCSVENLETTLDGDNPFTVRYVRPVYNSCNEGSQAVDLDLNGWYDSQGAFVPLRQEDDWEPTLRWLVGQEPSGCSPT